MDWKQKRKDIIAILRSKDLRRLTKLFFCLGFYHCRKLSYDPELKTAAVEFRLNGWNPLYWLYVVIYASSLALAQFADTFIQGIKEAKDGFFRIPDRKEDDKP